MGKGLGSITWPAPRPLTNPFASSEPRFVDNQHHFGTTVSTPQQVGLIISTVALQHTVHVDYRPLDISLSFRLTLFSLP